MTLICLIKNISKSKLGEIMALTTCPGGPPPLPWPGPGCWVTADLKSQDSPIELNARTPSTTERDAPQGFHARGRRGGAARASPLLVGPSRGTLHCSLTLTLPEDWATAILIRPGHLVCGIPVGTSEASAYACGRSCTSPPSGLACPARWRPAFTVTQTVRRSEELFASSAC
jgi:hypothetical protein